MHFYNYIVLHWWQVLYSALYIYHIIPFTHHNDPIRYVHTCIISILQLEKAHSLEFIEPGSNPAGLDRVCAHYTKIVPLSTITQRSTHTNQFGESGWIQSNNKTKFSFSLISFAPGLVSCTTHIKLSISKKLICILPLHPVSHFI